MREVKGIGKLAIISVSKTARTKLWEIRDKQFKKNMREVADKAIERYYEEVFSNVKTTNTPAD